MRTLSRREFIATSAAVGATLSLPGRLSAAEPGKKTFTILHTNDLHSNLIGMAPATDYSPFELNNDTTRGGYARLGAMILVAIPKYTKGKLPLQAKKKNGQPLTSRVEALDDPRNDTPDLLAPVGALDDASVDTKEGNGRIQEIKEWQAIMDHLRTLPAKAGKLPVIPVDERANEVRAIKAG